MISRISTPAEHALLKRLARLPTHTRHSRRVRHPGISSTGVLCWFQSIQRHGRSYSLKCNVLGDGAVEISHAPLLGLRKARRHLQGK